MSDVPTSLVICTLNNTPFVFAQFEFYVALLCISYVESIFVVHGRFQV
jgi:hypothetical protein